MEHTNIRESHLGFLQRPPNNPSRKTALSGTMGFTDEIFLKSINKSHIGKISGNTKKM